jgi:hypothetical protein
MIHPPLFVNQERIERPCPGPPPSAACRPGGLEEGETGMPWQIVVRGTHTTTLGLPKNPSGLG